MPGPDAVILLSGGLDSATVLAMAQASGRRCHAMSFDYGQRQRRELEAAAQLAAAHGCIQHRVVHIDLRAFGGSALTADIAVPKGAAAATPGAPTGSATGGAGAVPVTYVPARNTIFLSYALAWAEVLGAVEIHIGVNAVDYSGYPDCRPAFIAAYEALANCATAAAAGGRRMTICAPLQHLTKAEIIRAGAALGVDYGVTRSCYDPDVTGARACGACAACQLRRAGFAAAGVPDPTRYVEAPTAGTPIRVGRSES